MKIRHIHCLRRLRIAFNAFPNKHLDYTTTAAVIIITTTAQHLTCSSRITWASIMFSQTFSTRRGESS
jgi:hypothetical protein